MTPIEFIKELQKLKTPHIVEFNEGIGVRIGSGDIVAAELILWLLEKDDYTFSQIKEILDAAIWWITLFASHPKLEAESER